MTLGVVFVVGDASGLRATKVDGVINFNESCTEVEEEEKGEGDSFGEE